MNITRTVVIAVVIAVLSVMLIIVIWAHFLGPSTSPSTSIEKLDFVDVSIESDGAVFNITIILGNSGLSAATIGLVSINGTAIGSYTPARISEGNLTDTMKPGDIVKGTVSVPASAGWASGGTAFFKVTTVTGKEYSRRVTLP
jgi:hypothetical protein